MRTRKRLFLSWFFISFIGLAIVCFINIGTPLVMRQMAQNGYWQDHKAWKAQLMQSGPAPEIVLVGSSRVMNHIDTQYFAERGHPTFNYGVAGAMPWDFPYMVAQASRSARSTVVISIPAETLFLPPECPSKLTWTDVQFYLREKPSCLGVWSFRNWLQILPINGMFSEKVDPNSQIYFFPCSQENPVVALLNERFDHDYCEDVRKVTYIRGTDKRYVFGFQNGDGVILAKQPSEGWNEQIERLDYTGREYEPKSVAFLRHLAQIVRSNEKLPIFLIETAPIHRISIKHVVEKATGEATIYMNDIPLDPSEIADVDHVGPKGISHLTKELYDHLFPTVAHESH
ncbi:hypothetical protein GF108_08120 [Phyllobacterium sp. SYP-B3895]|uniref:hypothetical protein n=1 Tax=Phyllobacterium sp. SYP-B3895 TaxID=2663240 RepID=UPI001299B682|nr:hypothetical protein [Phyllobacterium sp. SYP-B3895]MRG55546.1 hypothetical protein [Phyllobacterium sp. SYP-B3895]